MAERKQETKSKRTTGGDYRQARIVTKSAEEMTAVLEGRRFELVGRGPRRMPDGEYVAEVIGTKAALDKVPKTEYRIEIRSLQRIKDPDKQVSRTNRYAKKGAIPKGIGTKK